MVQGVHRAAGWRAGIAGAVLLALCVVPVARGQEHASLPNLFVAYGNDGVTIVARSVPLRAIVQEWARLGDVRLANLQNVPTSPVTVELRDMPETLALEVLLRSLPGYVLQQRGPTAAGPSTFEKLDVMGPLSQVSSAASSALAGSAGGRAALVTPPDDAQGSELVDLTSPPPGIAPPTDGAVSHPPASSPSAGPVTRPATTRGQALPGATAVAPPPKDPGVAPR